MSGWKILLVLGLVTSWCRGEEGVDYLRTDGFELDSADYGQSRGLKLTNCSCGFTNKASGRIVGGEETGVNEYPYMAGLARVGYTKKYDMFCGASIVTQIHVISAAHCTVGEDERRLAIVVGEHDQIKDTESGHTRIHKVDRVINHEEYDDELSHNDITLLVLETKIRFSDAVGPICLPAAPLKLLNQFVRVTGWGNLEWLGQPSPVLMKVDLKVVSLEACAPHYYGGGIDLKRRHQFCTYSVNKDSCQGDSGGPVAYLDPETNRYTLAGVVSFGDACAGPSPGVNTDVSFFVDWIQYHINSDPNATGFQTCSKM